MSATLTAPANPTRYFEQVTARDSLAEQPEIYFEAGDHERLIHISREQFMRLMEQAGHGHFGHHGRFTTYHA